MPASGLLRSATPLGGISALAKLLRAEEWLGVAFIPLFLPFYYLLLVAGRPARESCGLFALVLVFGFLCGSFGFVINTLFDREQDRMVGKHYAMTEWPERRILLLLVALTLAAALALIPLALHTHGFLILGVSSFALGTAYSARGLRFKEHPILGPVIFSLSQFALPQLYVFLLFDYLGWETLLFFALFFVVGLRVILLHQLLDYANDLGAGVVTFATSHGIERTWLLFSKVLTPIEFFVLTFALVRADRELPGTLAFAACCAIVFCFWRRLSPISSVLPLQSSALLGFYWMFWPLFLLVVGIARNRFFFGLLVFHLLITTSFWTPYWGELRSALRRMPAHMRLIAALLAAYLAGQVYFHLSPVLGYHKSIWMTPVVTLVFFAFSAGHAALCLGKLQTAAFVIISSVVTMAAEILGARTGVIFGPYQYSDRLGWMVFGVVPLCVPLAWFMMIYSSYDLALLILDRRQQKTKGLWLLAFTGAVAMTAWDLVMDPQMVAEGFWVWTAGGGFFGIPFRNFGGWLATAFTVYLVYGLAARHVPSHPDPQASENLYFVHLPAVAYLLTSLSSSVSALQRGEPALFAIGASTLGVLVLATMRDRPAA